MVKYSVVVVVERTLVVEVWADSEWQAESTAMKRYNELRPDVIEERALSSTTLFQHVVENYEVYCPYCGSDEIVVFSPLWDTNHWDYECYECDRRFNYADCVKAKEMSEDETD